MTALVRFDPATQPEPRLPATARCLYQQYMAPVRYQTARLLGFDPAAVMTRRVVVLTIENQPVLTTTSYLPVELVAQGFDEDWYDIELGKLALPDHIITPASSRRSYSRLPTTIERETLGIPADTEIPVTLYVLAYFVHQVQPDPVRAGVIVRARADRVYWSLGRDYSGLLLEPGLTRFE